LQYKINFWEKLRIEDYENEGSKERKGREKGVAGERMGEKEWTCSPKTGPVKMSGSPEKQEVKNEEKSIQRGTAYRDFA